MRSPSTPPLSRPLSRPLAGLLLAGLLLVVVPHAALPCSTVATTTAAGPLVAKGYDWSDERGFVLVNKRGVTKRALVLDPRDTPASWTSQHASVSFNQYGREFPNGGMNDAGLVVEVLVLSSSRFPERDGRPVLNELQLVQFLLDQATTLDEAVRLAQEVIVVPAFARLHYFVCEASGACAALEFLEGKLVVARGDTMPARVLTNSTYADSRAALEAAHGTAPKGQQSRSRFVRLALAAAKLGPTAGVQDAYGLLERVRFPDSTQWQIVYEPAARRVHFRTRSHRAAKSIELARLDASCGAPALLLDLADDREGDATDRLTPYSTASNARLLEGTLGALGDQRLRGLAGHVATYPENTICVAPAPEAAAPGGAAAAPPAP